MKLSSGSQNEGINYKTLHRHDAADNPNSATTLKKAAPICVLFQEKALHKTDDSARNWSSVAVNLASCSHCC